MKTMTLLFCLSWALLSGCTQAELARIRSDAQKENCAKTELEAPGQLQVHLTTTRTLAKPLLISFNGEILVNECKHVNKVEFKIENGGFYLSSPINQIAQAGQFIISESDCKVNSESKVLFSTDLSKPVGIFNYKTVSVPNCAQSTMTHQISGEM